MKILHDDEAWLEEAARLLRDSHIVAFPTETVYGLGACLFCETAIEMLYQVKKRAYDKPFTAHICNLEQVHEIAIDLPDEFFLLAEKFLPGPLTIVVKKHPRISPLVTGGLDSIGIRMPNHPTALALLKKTALPLAASSANLSGQACINNRHDLFTEFADIAAFVDGGFEPSGLASTVVSLLDPKKPRILRQGALLLEDLLSL